MQSDRMNNPKYVNWVKAGTGLQYVKEGIEEFTSEHAQRLHDQIRSKVEQACLNAVGKTCTSCHSKLIVRRHRPVPRWSMNCSDSVCNHWLDAILSFHAGPPCPKVFWDNVDPKLWPTTPWEVAKTYQPYGCSAHKGSGDSDCTALLSLILDCTYFHKYISSRQLLRDIKDHRNKIVHGGSLEVDDSDLQLWMSNMIKFLEDSVPGGFSSLPQCQEAAKKIKELRDNALELTLNRDMEIQALKQLTDGLNNDIKRLQAGMDDVNREMDELKASNEDTHQHMAEIESRMTEMQSQINECLTTLDRSEAIVRGLDEFDVREETSEIRTKLQELEKKNVGDIRQLSEDLRREMSEIRKRVEEEINTLRKVKAEEEGGRPTIEYVRHDLITNYRRHCSHAPVYPLTPEITGQLLNFYVKPCMKVRYGRLEGSQMTTDASFKDIFTSGTKPKPCTNIFVVGESGVGKSTLCDYMVQAWCNAHMDRGDNLEDEETMKRFPLLFYISLRHSSPKQSIEDMIADQLIDIDVDKILNEECLIVLDGLDEWKADETDQTGSRFRHKGLPRLKSKCNCIVVTTSRPWKLECLRLSDGDIDREIHITGLDLSSTRTLTSNLTSELNKANQSEKDSSEFMEDMKLHGLDHFMNTPIVLKQILCLWYHGIPLGNSQCEIYTSLIERQLQLTELQKGTTMTLLHRSTSVDNLQLPDVLRNENYPSFNKYQHLLMALAKMAFHTLVNTDRESALVFDHNATSVHGMSDTDVEFCLQVGLLSQKQLYGKSFGRKKSLNFIHKSYHEYFAAMYLASHCESMSHVTEVCSTHQLIREIEDVTRFLCAMNPALCRELVSHLRTVVSGDSSLVQYRRNEGRGLHASYRILKNIQRAILELTTELEHSGYHQTCRLAINDLVVDSSNIDFIESKLSILDISALESITVSNSPDVDPDSYAKFNSLFKTVCQSKSLRKVSLDDMTGCIDAENVKEMISNSQKSLSSLQVSGVNFSALPRVSGLARLIWWDTFERMLRHLSLLSLNLENIGLRTNQLNALVKFLSRTSELRELHLTKLPIDEIAHGYSVDLSRHKKLEYLYLRKLHANTVRFNAVSLKVCSIGELHTAGCMKSVLGCLGTASQLERFECSSVEHGEDIDALVSAMQSIENVTSVSIGGVDFEERSPALSPRMKHLKTVRFFRVTMRNMAFKCLLDKLPPQKLTIDIDMATLPALAGTPHVPHYIRKHPERFSVGRCYKYESDHMWRMLFDKKETEDVSQTYIQGSA